MSEPHKVARSGRIFWFFAWLIHGVKDTDLRRLCKRCGVTGQGHREGEACWRFKR